MFNLFNNSSETIILCGLGNPGNEYAKTRHNVGFMVVDQLAEKFGVKLRKKWRSEYAEVDCGGRQVILLKPQTYMNCSGEAVKKFKKKFTVKAENIVAIYDEMSLKTGRLRIRMGGSAGGHNGVKSILQNLGGADFLRLRIGVDHPGKGADVADYVLSDFTLEEMELISPAVFTSVNAALMLCEENHEAAMNTFNGMVPNVITKPNQD